MMHGQRRLAVSGRAGVSLVIAVAFAAVANAGVPLPIWSTVDPRLVLCPAGDIAFHVLPRRINSPVPGATLQVDFCAATGWAFDPAAQPPWILFASQACVPGAYSDATGLATFDLRAGGTTADSSVTLYVDGILFGHRVLGSPDQNGDLLVSAADEAILLSKLGTTDLSADLDADGVVSEADHAIQRAHLGHASALPTAAAATSWGRIKARVP